MKNFLSNPTNGKIFNRYAPLLQGGFMKLSMLAGIIILCSFTMYRFVNTQALGLSDILTDDQIQSISISVGGLIGSLSIIHFASLLPLLVRDLIQMKKDAKEVHKGVLAINLIIVLGILGFDGYVSTTGMKNAVNDMGQDIASDKNENEASRINANYSQNEAKVMNLWRGDSANIVSYYDAQISAEKAKANGEIGSLKGKADRGAAAGSTLWASSLRSAASGKSSALENKVAKLEAEKADMLLKRAEKRDLKLTEKQTERSQDLGLSDGKMKRIESRFARYGGMTWVLSLGLYLLYIGTVVKHELIHFGSGIKNDVEVSEHYFKAGFVQTFLHEIGHLFRDFGIVVNGYISSWRKKMFENKILSTYINAPVYGSNESLVIAAAKNNEIGFKIPEKEKQSPLSNDRKFERENVDGKVKVTAHFEHVPPFVIEFDNDLLADEWESHIHPSVPIIKKKNLTDMPNINTDMSNDKNNLDAYALKVANYTKKATLKYRSKNGTVTPETKLKNEQLIADWEKELKGAKKQYEMQF